MALQFKITLPALALVVLGCMSPCLAQTSQPGPASASEPNPEQHHPQSAAGVPAAGPNSASTPEPRVPGSISGTVIDQSGAVVAGARITLTTPAAGDPSALNPSTTDSPASQEVFSGSDGQYRFANVAPGPFQLTMTSAGFAPQSFSGTLQPGEAANLPPIMLAVAQAVTEVQVGLPQVEVAEAQIKVEEQQRILGAIPNFYVTYVGVSAAPLTSKQKFELAWKSVIDPITLLIVGGTAGVEQAQNHFEQYGQGTEGFAKRFGAGYADTVSGTFIGGYILPSLLKQDPRYFYKGKGSAQSRILYAIAMSVICRGDNRRWQPNYSGIIGSLAAGGISNIYYPSADRDGLELTFVNAAIGIAENAATNVLQEFVVRKFTPKTHSHDTAAPQTAN